MATLLLTFKILDGEGNIRTMPLHYNESEVDTLAKAQGIATSLAPIIEGTITGEVIGAECTFPLTVPAPSNTASGRNDAGATLSYYVTGGTSDSLYIPTFDGLYLEQKKVVTEAPVDALNAALVSGTGVTGSYQAHSRHELNYTAYRGGKQSVRKN